SRRGTGLFARVEPREDDSADPVPSPIPVPIPVLAPQKELLAHVNAHPRDHAIKALRTFGEEVRSLGGERRSPAPSEEVNGVHQRARSPLPEMDLRDRVAADQRGT